MELDGLQAISRSGDECTAASGAGAVHAAVERDDPAVGADGVARERLRVGVERVGAERHAAGVVVLDDHARRALVAEPGEHRARAVEVEDVVERELLAVQLTHAAEHAAARASALGA